MQNQKSSQSTTEPLQGLASGPLLSLKDLSEDQQRALEAAYILSHERITQCMLAKRWRVSPSTMSRCVDLAKHLGVYVRDWVYVDRCHELTAKFRVTDSKHLSSLQDQILKKYGSSLSDVRVFRSLPQIATRNQWDQAALLFGQAAGPHVWDQLRRGTICGISWGRTLNAVYQGAADAHLPRLPGDQPTTVIPVWGSFHGPALIQEKGRVFTDYAKLSSTYLASGWSRLLNRSKETSYSLESVPSFVPNDFDLAGLQVLKNFFQSEDISAYKHIFGAASQKNLIAGMDALLVAVGSPKDYCKGLFYDDHLLRWLHLEAEDLPARFIGDIGLILLPKDAKGEQFAAEINAKSICFRKEHLVDCVERARRRKTPGVIALAVGRTKAAVLHASICDGLVNQAVLDVLCAEALLKLKQ